MGTEYVPLPVSTEKKSIEHGEKRPNTLVAFLLGKQNPARLNFIYFGIRSNVINGQSSRKNIRKRRGQWKCFVVLSFKFDAIVKCAIECNCRCLIRPYNYLMYGVVNGIVLSALSSYA